MTHRVHFRRQASGHADKSGALIAADERLLATTAVKGRQIVFVEPSAISTLDLTDTTRSLLPLVLDGEAFC